MESVMSETVAADMAAVFQLNSGIHPCLVSLNIRGFFFPIFICTTNRSSEVF